MSIPMPITFLHAPQLIDDLPGTNVDKQPYKKENRLDRLSLLQAQGEDPKKNTKQTVIDQSLKTIFEKVIYTITSIIEDLLNLDEVSIRKVVRVFIEGDRMVYVGISVVTLSLLLFMITMTS